MDISVIWIVKKIIEVESNPNENLYYICHNEQKICFLNIMSTVISLL